MKRFLSILFIVLLLTPVFALGEGEFPLLNENGFMDEDEFVYENANDGIWRYCSQTLKVEITKHVEVSPSKQTYYVAEIWSTPENSFFCCPADWNKWENASDYPAKIAKANGLVFAVNGDYYYERSDKKKGIILRNGQIINTQTYTRGYNNFPNLDTLALFPNGFMMVSYSDEYTAEEYLELGANDVMSFGPVLIRDGEYGENIEKYGQSHAPRTAVGMVETGHYFAVMYEGRHTAADGVTVKIIAQKMMELGCTQAFNLDGGETAGMVFMGTQLNVVGEDGVAKKINCRRQSDVLAIGYSSLVK